MQGKRTPSSMLSYRGGLGRGRRHHRDKERNRRHNDGTERNQQHQTAFKDPCVFETPRPPRLPLAPRAIKGTTRQWLFNLWQVSGALCNLAPFTVWYRLLRSVLTESE
eukprot:TRINITY_DN1169_c0_g1_i3.p1 TRINITY_DN1169_c0_g1~~TRINITY_DN1169_c0_g1_i3.p1  ORF type:complete len:108 (+),score=0.59 TRINITY_DN1169_c0_g1_i3:163-486(+)